MQLDAGCYGASLRAWCAVSVLSVPPTGSVRVFNQSHYSTSETELGPEPRSAWLWVQCWGLLPQRPNSSLPTRICLPLASDLPLRGHCTSCCPGCLPAPGLRRLYLQELCPT